MQRKADVYELSRNLQIHKFTNLQIPSFSTYYELRKIWATICLPTYVVYFQAVKVDDDLICVYKVGMFEFKVGSGYLERATVWQLVNSPFRSLVSVELGFVSEEDLEKGEEIEF